MDKIDYEAKLATETEKLKAYQRALAEEYEKIKSEANDGAPLIDAAVTAQKIEQKLLKAADEAADTVIDILDHGDKDTVRLSAAKYILDNIKGKVTPDADPWETIIQRLTKEQDAAESEA